jgi:hypothetical protein
MQYRPLELADLKTVTIGDGEDRLLLCLSLSEQEGGHAADAVQVIAAGKSAEQIYAALEGKFAVQEIEGRLFVRAFEDHNPETQIPLSEQTFNERLMTVDIPVGQLLRLDLWAFKLDEIEMSSRNVMKP